MSFFQKRDNLILTGLVAGFFVILATWHDLGGIRSTLFGGSAGDAFEVVFIDGDNQKKTLQDFKGTPLVVNFWATWCPACVSKMHTVNKLAAKVEAAGGAVLNISNDQRGISTVKAYYEQNAYRNLPVYIDSTGNLMHSFGARGLPTAILIDAQGNVVAQIEGAFDWSSDKAVRLVRSKLGLNIN